MADIDPQLQALMDGEDFQDNGDNIDSPLEDFKPEENELYEAAAEPKQGTPLVKKIMIGVGILALSGAYVYWDSMPKNGETPVSQEQPAPVEEVTQTPVESVASNVNATASTAPVAAVDPFATGQPTQPTSSNAMATASMGANTVATTTLEANNPFNNGNQTKPVEAPVTLVAPVQPTVTTQPVKVVEQPIATVLPKRDVVEIDYSTPTPPVKKAKRKYNPNSQFKQKTKKVTPVQTDYYIPNKVSVNPVMTLPKYNPVVTIEKQEPVVTVKQQDSSRIIPESSAKTVSDQPIGWTPLY